MKTRLPLILTLLIVVVLVLNGLSQDTKTVSGVVTFRKIPLNKVIVQVLSTGAITKTDTLGRFEVKCAEKDILKFIASGFEVKELNIKKQKLVDVKLKFEYSKENIEKAVAGGHISENTLVQATLPPQVSKEKDYSTYQSIYQLISSEIYEVEVSGTTIYNKKNTSLESHPKVLYVVDGKIVSDISYVAPINVKYVEFIDNTSAAIWGMQGANGVIQITLK